MQIVAGLLKLAADYAKRKEYKEAQDNAEAVDDNPVDWFNDHFGVQQPKSHGKAKATETKNPS